MRQDGLGRTHVDANDRQGRQRIKHNERNTCTEKGDKTQRLDTQRARELYAQKRKHRQQDRFSQETQKAQEGSSRRETKLGTQENSET